MLTLIWRLITAIKSGDLNAILSAIANLISGLVAGETKVSLTMTPPGEVHPEDTTASHTITLN